MGKSEIDTLERAGALYLRLVPSIALRVEEETPLGSTIAERALVSRQVALAAISEAAERAKMKPAAYAQALMTWIAYEKGFSYWQAATMASMRKRGSDISQGPGQNVSDGLWTRPVSATL
ncbi:hypothetical protein AADS62_004674 [Escherichia coli]